MTSIDIKSFPLNNIHRMKDEEILRLCEMHGASKRLEFMAVENGDVDAVKNLITRGFDVDFEVDGESMASLAVEHEKSEILLSLLNANVRFPKNFKLSEAFDEIKKFVESTKILHTLIKSENIEKIAESLQSFPNLKYFYDTSNHSAMRTAIEFKKFKIVEFLLEQNVMIGPHEDIEEVTNNLNENEKKILRDIHEKLSSKVLSEPMTTLMQNSFVAPDVPRRKENLNFIHGAYDFLLKIPLIAIILEIVAASRNFKIIFDFNRDSVMFMDPNSDPETNALFYFSGRIYIAAKDLLEDGKQFEIYSIMAHELCHYAMFLVFDNMAKPYYDRNSMGLCDILKEQKLFDVFRLFNKSSKYKVIHGQNNINHNLNNIERGLGNIKRRKNIAKRTNDIEYGPNNIDSIESDTDGIAKEDGSTGYLDAFQRSTETKESIENGQNYIDNKFESEVLSEALTENNAETIVEITAKESRNNIAKSQNNIENEITHPLIMNTSLNDPASISKQQTSHDNLNHGQNNIAYTRKNAEILFNRISVSCISKMNQEEIIENVFELYDEEEHHSELIVRVPQIIAVYQNNPEMIAKNRENYKQLFDFYERFCVPEMKSALPKIKAKNRSEYQKKIARQRKIIFGLLGLIVLLISFGGFLGYFLYNPDLKWSELSDEQKVTVKNASLKFEEIECQVKDLFGENLEVYEKFSSNIIKSALRDDSESLSEHVKSFNESYFEFSWNNLTENFKTKILSRDVTFQGKSVKVAKVFGQNSLQKLTSIEILNILKGKTFEISTQLELKSKVYIERKFIEKIGESHHYTNSHELHKTFDEILTEIEGSKIFFLSSSAGEGKSTSFRHFWFKLKEKFPSKWIEFVDLKKHIEAFEIDFENLPKFLTENLLNLKNIEKEIFIEKFKSNEVIFLWDGVDEIAPIFKKVFVEFVGKIKNSTENFQFISTRPLVFTSNEVQESLRASSYNFAPLSDDDKFELLVKLTASSEKFKLDPDEAWRDFQNSKSSLNSSVSNSLKILNSISSSNPQKISPLLLQMIADVSQNQKFHLNSTLNFYNFYEIFINQKLKIVRVKNSPVIGGDLDKFARNENLMKAHKAFALKLLYGSHEPLVSSFFRKSTKNVESHEISRYGILNVYPDGDFDFNHRTFAEFFVSMFLIEKIENFEVDKNVADIFVDALVSGGIVEKFLVGFEEWTNVKVKKVIERHLRIEKVIEDESLKKFLRFVNVAELFDGEVEDLRLKVSLNFDRKSMESLIKFYDEIKEIFGESLMKFLYFCRLSEGENISHKFIESPSKLLTLMEQTLTSDEILKVLSMQDDKGQNFLMKVAPTESLQTFLNYLTKTFNFDQIKNLLNFNNNKNLTALQLSNENFVTLKNFYLKFFTVTELQEILTRFDKEELPFFETFEDQTLIEVSNFLEFIFENQTFDLRNFISHRNIHGSTIFSQYKDRNFPGIFELLKKTFNDSLEFENFFKDLQQRTFRLFEGLDRNSTKAQFLNVKGIPWNENCAQFWVDNWEKVENQIGTENLKDLLIGGNEFNETIFSNLFVQNFYTQSPRGFFGKLKKTLNRAELRNLIDGVEGNCRVSPLMLASEYATVNDLKEIWEIFEENFDDQERKEILMKRNEKNSNTILHYSTRNHRPEIFKIISEIYLRTFNTFELRKLFTKMTDKGKVQFFKNLTENKKVYKSFLDFVYEIFHDDKHQLGVLMKNLSLASKVEVEEVWVESNTRLMKC